MRSRVKIPALLPADPTERVLFCCAAAARHEERGDYARAIESLDPFWGGPGSEFTPDRLTTEAQATLLLRAGSLTGWLGSQLIPQTLSWILQSRHRDLRPYPKRKRRCVSLIKGVGEKVRRSSKS